MTTRRWALSFAPLVAAAIGAVPLPAHAAWDALQYVTIEPFGDLASGPDLESMFAAAHPEGFAEDTKVQGIAYVDEFAVVKFATRSAHFDSSIADAPWSVHRASDLHQAGRGADLAFDTVTGRPYIGFVDPLDEPWLTTYAGPFGGNCGTDQSWSCVNLATVCNLAPDVDPASMPRVALGGIHGEPADTIHAMFSAGEGFYEAWWSVESQTWTCSVHPAEWFGRPRSEAPVIRHEYDDRLKPQLLLATGEAQNRRTQMRSMLDYVDTPLPRWGTANDVFWDFELLIDPDLALLDDGIFDNPPALEGFGRPAIAVAHIATGGDFYIAPDCSSQYQARVFYREAEDPQFQAAKDAELVAWGQVCKPDLAFSAGGVPWIAYQNDLDDVYMAARDNGEEWTRDLVIAGASEPEIVYDHIDKTATVVGRSSLGGLVVADGFWDP